MTRLLKLCAEPFQELPRETLIDETRQAAWLLLTLTCLGLLWRILP